MGRIWVGATCCGKAERLFEMATSWAAERKQFGQAIGKFQATGFKLADMAVELRAADLLVKDAISKADQGVMTDSDAAMVKLYCSEMLNRVADNTVQIYGGMGLMDDLPVQRLWRDSRLERIWDGTSKFSAISSPATCCDRLVHDRTTPAKFTTPTSPRHVALAGGGDVATVINECSHWLQRRIMAGEPKTQRYRWNPLFFRYRGIARRPGRDLLRCHKQAAIDITARLARRGAGGLCVIQRGFLNLGLGQQAEAELVDAAGEMALLGPNCYGLINYRDQLALWPFAHGGTHPGFGAPSSHKAACCHLTSP